MGLGKFLGQVGKVFSAVAPAVGVVNPAIGIALSTTGQAAAALGPRPSFQPSQPVSAGFPTLPSIEALTGVPSFLPTMAAVPAAAAGTAEAMGTVPAVMGMTREVALAISKLAGRLGIPVALASLSRVGIRIWGALQQFARRHPNISLTAMLAALGLVESEIAAFLGWGSTKRRRRRRGGISARDIRATRRTLRRVAAIEHDLSHLRAHRVGRRAFRARDGVSVVRAG